MDSKEAKDYTQRLAEVILGVDRIKSREFVLLEMIQTSIKGFTGVIRSLEEQDRTDSKEYRIAMRTVSRLEGLLSER